MADDFLEIEGGTDDLLLETGDKLLLESSTGTVVLLLRMLSEGLFVGEEMGVAS